MLLLFFRHTGYSDVLHGPAVGQGLGSLGGVLQLRTARLSEWISVCIFCQYIGCIYVSSLLPELMGHLQKGEMLSQ